MDQLTSIHRISITVTQIKTKGDQKGWEVQVRITANDITIISFSVETLKTVGNDYLISFFIVGLPFFVADLLFYPFDNLNKTKR